MAAPIVTTTVSTTVTFELSLARTLACGTMDESDKDELEMERYVFHPADYAGDTAN